MLTYHPNAVWCGNGTAGINPMLAHLAWVHDIYSMATWPSMAYARQLADVVPCLLGLHWVWTRLGRREPVFCVVGLC